jgi:hypothetical protein
MGDVMKIVEPQDLQLRQEEQALDVLMNSLRAKLDVLVHKGVKVSVLGNLEAVAQDVVDRLGVAENPWAEIIGPSYTSGTLQRELGVGRGAVSKAVSELRVLRLVTSDGVTLYPAFQVRGGKLVPGLREVLTVLRSGLDDPWTWAQWLNTPLRDDRGEILPRNIDRLAVGDLDGVLNDARHDAAAWAA